MAQQFPTPYITPEILTSAATGISLILGYAPDEELHPGAADSGAVEHLPPRDVNGGR